MMADNALTTSSAKNLSPKSPHITPWFLCSIGTMIFLIMIITPLVITVLLSFNRYDPNLGAIAGTFTFANFSDIFSDSWYWEIFGRTVWVSFLVTLLCAIIAIPEAMILNRMDRVWRSIMLVVILSPLLISVVIRSFGWSLLLADNGLVNRCLEFFGIPTVTMLYQQTAVIIALVHVMMPFMLIPLWTTIQKMDPEVENAALSLNASRFKTFYRVLLPQMTPGILSGCLIVFALSASSFVIPGILGGRRFKVVATLIYDQYLSELNWPSGAALALILLLANVLIIVNFNRLLQRTYKAKLED
ncbi:ABC transporter permease [Vibrio porteresiae]|uniref:ABC transporter permease n=1 Tax=Vibrio porteresiae DSM 19223 TaxID=1123496 RepID=A0ABZ0QB27_9VIBR|nr:ABC transporter permease [Vibrio porteresiae]WPC72753.1 ABC transporter permease [Vibrio porteresiae DSM 19223]